jgi:hypothetical protein
LKALSLQTFPSAAPVAPRRVRRKNRSASQLVVLQKSWSMDLHAECTRKFGGDCHWVTLHGNHGGGSAHVLLSPPQGKEKHRRVVWAPEGTGLEHLRMEGLGSNDDIRTRAKAKAKQRAVVKKTLSKDEVEGERNLVNWSRDKMQKLHGEVHNVLKEELGDEFGETELSESTRAIARRAQEVLRESGQKVPTGSDGKVARPDIDSGEGTEPSAGEEAEDAGFSSRSVREAVANHAASILASEITGAPPMRSKKVDALPEPLQRKIQEMTPESAQRILQQMARTSEFQKNAKKVLQGRMSRTEAEASIVSSVSPDTVETEIKKRVADAERVRYNSALWQQVGSAYADGARHVGDAFTRGGTEAISSLVSKSLGSGVSPGVVGSLGLSGIAHVLAHELARTGGYDDVRSVQDLTDYIEMEADTLRDEDGPLSEVNELRDQMQFNESLRDTDLNERTVASLNARLSAQAQKILGNVAGRLEAGAEMAKALRTVPHSANGDLTLTNGINSSLIVAQMEAAGLSPDDYTITEQRDDKGEHLAVTIKADSFPKILRQSKRDEENEEIRSGSTVKEYKHPAGWTDDPKLQLKPQQIQHVQFWQKNRRTLADASTGFGKTPVALACALHLKEEMAAEGRKPRVLVLTTAGVRDQYGEECAKFAPGLEGDYRVAGGTGEENAAAIKGDQTLTICAHDALVHNADEILQQNWDAIIVDEADKLISPAAGEPSIREGVFNALSSAAPDMLCATATPLRNSVQEYWKMLHLLRPTRFPRYADFEAQYENLGAGTRAYDAAISEALNNETRDTVLSSRMGEGTKHEHFESVVPVMDNDQWREMHAEIERQFGEDRAHSDPEIASKAASRRDVEHMKVSYDISEDNPVQTHARSIADKAFQSGERGIVFADYMPILDTFRNAYKPGEWMEYSGRVDTQSGRREELKHALNHGALIRGVRVALGHQGKGAEGVIDQVHRAPVSAEDRRAGKQGEITGYTVQLDDGSGEGKYVTVPADANMKSLLRGLVATRAAQYGLNLQEGGRYVMRMGHPYTPTAYEQEVGRLRSREQSAAGRPTWDHTLSSDHPVAGVRRRNIFNRKAQLTRGREHYLRSDEYGVG